MSSPVSKHNIGHVPIMYFLLLAWLCAGNSIILAQVPSSAEDIFDITDRRQIDTGSIFFPQSAGNERVQAIVYQELISQSNNDMIYLSASIKQRGVWTQYNRFSTPIPLSREDPPLLFSAVMTDDDVLIIALLSDPSTISIYRYVTGDSAPMKVTEIFTEITTVAPSLFQRSDGEVICFMSSRELDSERQSIYFTISDDDGSIWSSPRLLSRPPGNHASFLPTYTALGNREIVIFQSLIPNQTSVYQLYFTYTDTGGGRWSNPLLITNFRLLGEQESPGTYDNQQPAIVSHENRVLLAWERRIRGGARRLVYTELDLRGDIVTEPVFVTTDSELGSRPQLLVYRNRALMSWSGGQGRNRFVSVSMQNTSGAWISQRISRGQAADFSSLVLDSQNSARVSWSETQAARNASIYTESISLPVPDIQFYGSNFQLGQPSRSSIANIAWQYGKGSRQINGFRYSWSFGEATSPDGDISLSAAQNNVRLIANREGEWYFTLQTQDSFGNWLDPLTVQYMYDISPPADIQIVKQPEVDDEGFLRSNTVDIAWNTDGQEDTAGYYLYFRRVGDVDQPLEQIEIPLPNTFSINYYQNRLQNINLRNGLWKLRIVALDQAGNAGQIFEQNYRLNKYTPSTRIYSVASLRENTGPSVLTINGSGFLEDGQIEECILDVDGNMPYDYQFSAHNDTCQVINNTKISGIPLLLIRSGNYYVGLEHSKRGITFSSTPFELLSSGQVLFGQFEVLYAPEVSTAGISLSNSYYQSNIILVCVIVILTLLLFFLFSRLLITIKESQVWKKELKQLDYASNNRYNKEAHVAEYKKLKSQGISLRIKFTIFITLLVIVIVLLISIILGSSSLRRQEHVLSTSLQDRVLIFLDSVSTQAATIFLNSDSIVGELSPLIEQISVLEEAQYITITGATRDSRDNKDNKEYGAVWDTSDSNILDFGITESPVTESVSLNTEQFLSGESILSDAISPSVLSNIEEINRSVGAIFGTLPQRILEQNAEIQERVRLVQEGSANIDDLQVLDEQLNDLNIELGSALRQSQVPAQSFPPYNAQRLDRSRTTYIFYRPIIAWHPEEVGLSGLYYQGMVRVGISTDSLLEQLRNAQNEIVLATLIVAAIATVIGILGASLLATIVVAPIRRVVSGVEVISATDDKSDLREHTISVRSNDELAVLAQSVNQMTRGLVRASDASKELTVGKEVQKLFIPLTKDDLGNKLSIAENKYTGIEISGYYEGAHGVSGDYFSYARLDEENFVLIKCDVSGKGVPAALIMVEVATIFSDFTYQNDAHKKKNALAVLATRINDLLESVQFKGRFAALTMAIINQNSGTVRVTNAGDKQIHIYRHKKQHVEIVNLPETPAAGVFPSIMLPNGFVEQTLQLEKNDMLLFFTDGIDESRRIIRNPDFSPRMVADGKRTEEESEDFGVERIHDIVGAVMSNSRYTLQRKNELSPSALQFDYRDTPNNALSLVKAIVAAEHVFRLNPIHETNSKLHAHDDQAAVRIDKEIDAFLAKAFVNYQTFFSDKLSPSEEDNYHCQYGSMHEDEQYDDLTLLVVSKI